MKMRIFLHSMCIICKSPQGASIFSGVNLAMDSLDCVGIELIIEGLRQKLFATLNTNMLESSAFCDKEGASDDLEIEILDKINDTRSQEGISIERTLIVRIGTTKYRYYILKLRGFYCLPAFLAPNLPCTPGYLRLEVENQMHHYYIFTNQVEIPSILNGTVYKFVVPVLQQAVALTVSTKDINIFLNCSCLPDDLYERYSDFDPEQGSFTFNILNQSYSIVSNSRLASQFQEYSSFNFNLFNKLRQPTSVILNTHSFIFLLFQESSPVETI